MDDTSSLEDDDVSNDVVTDEENCMICMMKREHMMSERKTARKMIPCGHLTICKTCFHRVDRCPLCRRRYQNNEQIMTMLEERRLISKLQRVSSRRDVLDEKISELQTKRARVDEEFQELTAIRQRQRVLLRRRATQLDVDERR